MTTWTLYLRVLQIFSFLQCRVNQVNHSYALPTVFPLTDNTPGCNTSEIVHDFMMFNIWLLKGKSHILFYITLQGMSSSSTPFLSPHYFCNVLPAQADVEFGCQSRHPGREWNVYFPLISASSKISMLLLVLQSHESFQGVSGFL